MSSKNEKNLLRLSKRIKTQFDESFDDLCDLKQIEQKFQEFCNNNTENWYQLIKQDEKTLLRRQALNRGMNIIKSQAILMGKMHDQKESIASNLDHKQHSKQKSGQKYLENPYTNQMQEEKIKFFVSNYFRVKCQRTEQKANEIYHNENIHLLVRKYGSFLSDALIDSLVSETVKQIFGDNCPPFDHYGTAQKILNQFQISAIDLIKLQNPAQRQSYVMEKFNQTIQNLLRDWDFKITQKQKKQKLYDEEHRNNKDKQLTARDDVYSWFQVKTKYDSLKKQLRTIVMEQMNEYENQLKIMEALKKMDNHEFKQKDHIQLNGIQKVKTSYLVARADPKVGQLMQSLKIGNKQQSQKHHEIFSTAYIVPDFEWNDGLEKKFLKERNSAKFKYFSFINHSNFNQLACVPLFQEISPEDPKFQQRDIKLAKYQSGDWLTPEELKFLANTSQLLNQCVDKNAVNKALKTIDSQQIMDLETNLAEQIILNHETLMEKLKKSRIEYLKRKTQERQKYIQRQQENNERKKQYMINKKNNEKLSKRLQVVCDKMEQNISIKDQIYRNIYAQIFVRVIQRKLKELRERKQLDRKKWNENYREEEEKKKQHKEKIKQLASPIQQKNPNKSKLHPSSKIPFFPKANNFVDDDESEEQKNFQKRKQIMDQKVKEYKLKSIDCQFQDKLNFTRFYSSGPIKGLRTEPLYNKYDPSQPIVITPKELQAITKIQKAIKRYLAQKYLYNHREVYYMKKFRSYYQKLEDRVNGNYMVNLINQLRKSNLKTKNQNTGEISVLSSDIKLSQTAGKSILKTAESESFQEKLPIFEKDKLKKSFLSPKQSVKHTQRGSQKNESVSSTNRKPVTQIYDPRKILVKHQRLLRYSKLNIAQGITKSGFLFTKDDMDVVDEDGNTALYYAALNNNKQLVDYLLSHGACPNVLCSDNTPLHLAFRSQNLDIIMPMIERRGDLNVLNQIYQTPLIYGDEQLLKRMGLIEGVCTVQNGISKFDNNKLLRRKQQYSFYE